MAAPRKNHYRARVGEDGRLQVEKLALVPGQEFIIELIESDEDSEFARLVAWETMRPWYDTAEEDEAWKHLQEET